MSIAESARRLLVVADTLTTGGGADDATLEHRVHGREGLARWVTAGAGSLSSEDAETVRRLLALDGALLETLVRRRAALLVRLLRLEETRHSIAAYRGAPDSGARFVERLG